jgi:membrane associated rhomboid family serine protease
MRFYFGGKMTPVVLALLIANAAVFAVQVLFATVGPLQELARSLPGGGLETTMGLSISRFRPWQPFTYMFFHDPEGITHVLFNMFTLWLFGKDVERTIRGRRFLFLYISAGIFAGLCHLALAAALYPSAPVIGASGAVFGILVAYAVLFPQNRIWFIRAPFFVAGLIALESLLLVTSAKSDHVAHLAHVGGAAWGFLFFKGRSLFGRVRQKVEYQQRVLRSDRDRRLRARVDSLLDKISRQGIGSLTKRERDFLKKAGRRFRR